MSIDRFFRKVRTIITADRRQRSLIIKSVLMIGLFRFLLELFPFRTSRRVIARLGRGVARESPPSRPEDIAAAVKVASGNLLRERPCLPQAIVLHILYRRRGIESDLRIGAKREADGKIQAHAWVERNGRVDIGMLRDLRAYQPFPAFNI